VYADKEAKLEKLENLGSPYGGAVTEGDREGVIPLSVGCAASSPRGRAEKRGSVNYAVYADKEAKLEKLENLGSPYGGAVTGGD
ncbi:MAG: hypothetical protein J6K32_00205, partial [Clostridia bacterium]|nr:hypothetical protein [Clostridia bacterium]